MKISKTQWGTPEQIGMAKSDLDYLYTQGRLTRRRTTNDSGERTVHNDTQR